MRRSAAVTVLAAAMTVALLAPATAGGRGGGGGDDRGRHVVQPTLVARATLSADFIAPGPPSGAAATPANGRQGPFPGQVVPGFSGMVDAGDGTFWGLTDNGFGSKANSADFLLRLYRVTPDWQTARGGAGQIQVGEFISLRDPDRRIDFPIVNDATPDRLLTGADLDVESVVRAKDGTFWIGEEFGPFLLHVDASGKLLAPPVPFVGGKSPQNPYLEPGETPNIRASRGFEALASSRDGRLLYPITEGAFVDDPQQRRRTIYEFDTAAGSYTGRTWAYQTHRDANLVGDAFMTGRGELLLIERDDFEGPASVVKRVYRVDLRRTDPDGYLTKTLVLDALKIANPDRLGSGDGYGTDDPFALPVQSFETVVQLRDGRLLIANDNNYPGNAARIPGTPDDTEMALIDLRTVRTPHASDVTVVGHRGASGYRPEHTLASYETAILQCADYIEPDLVATKDGVLVARHENEIGGTTDVAARPEFAARQVTKVIDGRSVTGWFTEDFTLAELRTLRARERLPEVRPANTAFDGLYEIPTLDEVLDLARHSVSCDGRQVGVYPETKHPTYFDSLGLSLEEPLVAQLAADGLDGRRAPVIIQSFETGNLRQLDSMTRVRLAQLVDCSGAPYDLVVAGDPRTYRDLVTRRGLAEISRYADGVGLCKDLMIPRTADGSLGAPTPVIRDAHRAGLEVHGWTFRRENQFLPAQFRSSADPNAPGDLAGEIRVFVGAGMDGLFSDNPDIAAATVG
ncbi:esterase-like activity of phytase family protein [Cellulomonas fengjieae]|uniref:glycerophosphodiester phosphodiesterase n=1 Tax=Cellulomonas fengjieae TaxID=2819978 RepID=A0ABS3SKX2_9CELL|nr:esterase-like activity of phytase family protein [Cellulomonas fengjieae]MBO3086383.1 esterase-like activity of phytase family protein [Cellulomonas fengjieae]QVI66745.1 esterase-like activity of phytase family protein [Cellulomonas fengjieae]